jgi:hypothetical protein
MAAVLRRLRPQIINVHTAVCLAADDDNAHAGRGGAGRVGAVSRGRDQHDVASRLSAIVVIRANHHQPGELALRA